MWWELDSMFGKINPQTWGPTKWALVISFLVTLVGVLLIRLGIRRLRWIHVVLVLFAAAAIVSNFIYGGMTRGFLGTAVTVEHSTVWKLTLAIHAGSSIVYFIGVIQLCFIGTKILRGSREQELFVRHRRIGYRTLLFLLIVALLALPL